MPVIKRYIRASALAIRKAKELEASANGHYFTDGQRVELKIKEVDCFSFDTHFGTTFICKFVDESGKMFKYMGSNPPDVSKDEFTVVKATIKHDNYKGINETKIQRIKAA